MKSGKFNSYKGRIFLFCGIVCIALALLCVFLTREKDDDFFFPATMRPHLMVNGQIYWMSSKPPVNPDYDSSHHNFTCIGEVQSTVADTPTENFQAYGLSVGTELYGNEKLPQIIYVETGATPTRYATSEAMRDYLYHNGTTYISLTSVSYEDSPKYDERYGTDITVDEIPEGAAFIGSTNFIGYDMFVSQELQSNTFWEPAEVYRDGRNPDLLYAGYADKLYWIYVPLDS